MFQILLRIFRYNKLAHNNHFGDFLSLFVRSNYDCFITFWNLNLSQLKKKKISTNFAEGEKIYKYQFETLLFINRISHPMNAIVFCHVSLSPFCFNVFYFIFMESIIMKFQMRETIIRTYLDFVSLVLPVHLVKGLAVRVTVF